ncbi:MAG TPA: hypothetical protein VLB02_00545 [Candidatus Paceibacterota bacterium]|nr:hypothetical protein [Candidatus Paceibacterota bacterium]
MLISRIPKLSDNAKIFFKEQNINNFLELAMLPRAKTKGIFEEKLRREIQNFHNDVLEYVWREEITITFSKCIPPPTRTPSRDQEKTLIALLLFEHFFGNKRQIKAVRDLYLPKLYASTNDRVHPRRSHRKTKFLAIQYFSIAS